MSRAEEVISLIEELDIRTLKGTKIKRNKPVGKKVSGVVYVHKDYAHLVVPEDALALSILLPKGFLYRTVIYDAKKKTIAFNEAPDFDNAREPHGGKTFMVDITNQSIKSEKYTNQIWHHKWQWVLDDYKGFSVQKSKEWSHEWTGKVIGIAKGFMEPWKKQLQDVGLK